MAKAKYARNNTAWLPWATSEDVERAVIHAAEIRVPEVQEEEKPKDPIETLLQKEKKLAKQKKEFATIAKIEKAVEKVQQDLKLVDIIDEKIEMILERLTPEALEGLKPKDLAVIAGILFDKREALMKIPESDLVDVQQKQEKKKPVKLRVLWSNEGGGVEVIEEGGNE